MSLTIPYAVMPVPVEILQKILVNVIVSLHSSLNPEPHEAQIAKLHTSVTTIGPQFSFEFGIAPQWTRSWRYEYLAGDFRVLKEVQRLRLVSRK